MNKSNESSKTSKNEDNEKDHFMERCGCDAVGYGRRLLVGHIDELPLEAPEQSRPTMTIVATQGDDADTRLAYNTSADGKQINMTWTEVDVLYVMDGTNFVEFTLTDGAGTNKGTFTPATGVMIPDTWVSGETQLMACNKNDATLLVQQSGMSMLGLMYDNADLNAIQTQTAMSTMNSAISSYNWQYVANTDADTQTTEPLKLQKLEATGN